MPLESQRNIGFVCAEHAPKAGAFSGDPNTLIGKFVKLAFSEKDPGKRIEHMWVKVLKWDAKAKELEGVLNNDPVLDVGYLCGDELSFSVDEIEAVNK